MTTISIGSVFFVLGFSVVFVAMGATATAIGTLSSRYSCPRRFRSRRSTRP